MTSFIFSLGLVLGGIFLCGFIAQYYGRMAERLKKRVIVSTSDLLKERQTKLSHYFWLQNVFAACGALLVLAMLIIIAVGINA